MRLQLQEETCSICFMSKTYDITEMRMHTGLDVRSICIAGVGANAYYIRTKVDGDWTSGWSRVSNSPDGPVTMEGVMKYVNGTFRSQYFRDSHVEIVREDTLTEAEMFLDNI